MIKVMQKWASGGASVAPLITRVFRLRRLLVVQYLRSNGSSGKRRGKWSDPESQTGAKVRSASRGFGICESTGTQVLAGAGMFCLFPRLSDTIACPQVEAEAPNGRKPPAGKFPVFFFGTYES